MKVKGKYFRSADDSGIACEIILNKNELFIYPDDGESGLLIWKFRGTGSLNYNGELLTVSGGEAGERFEIGGNDAVNLYQTLSSSNDKTYSQRKSINWFYTGAAFILLLIVGFGLLTYFLLIPWLVTRAVGAFPKDYEIRLGESLSEVYLRGDVKDSADHYASEFVSGLDFNTDYPVNIHVLRSDEINAFALPGGNIFIYTGLLKKMEHYGQLVALLGHEVTHVTERHALRSMFRKAAAGLILTYVFGDISEVSAWMLSRAHEFSQLGYSRDLEVEADNYGLKIMELNQTDPNAMLQLLEILKSHGASQPETMKYLSTHPDTGARIGNIRAQLQERVPHRYHPDLEAAFNGIKRNLFTAK